MGNYKNVGNYKPSASGGVWEVIENYKQVSTGSSKAFSFSEIDHDNYSMLVLVFDLGTSASLALQLQFNTLTTASYQWTGYTNLNATEATVTANGDTSIEIASTALIISANDSVKGVVKIFLNKAGTKQRIGCLSEVTNSALDGYQKIQGSNNGDSVSGISEVLIKTSTSTWKADSRFTLYKVKRT